MYSIRPKLIKALSHRDVFWSIPTAQKEIFVTFDDGPVPRVTEFVLKVLKEFDARATFFCVGDNVRKNKDIYHNIISSGHEVGNHSFHHIDGWKHSVNSYCSDVELCDNFLKSKLFRPPYGRLKPSQRKILQNKYYIIYWSLLSGDFDKKISPEKCYQNTVSKKQINGSIVVFHDSYKTEQKLKYALPRFLEYYSKLGYSFSAITENHCTAVGSRSRVYSGAVGSRQ